MIVLRHRLVLRYGALAPHRRRGVALVIVLAFVVLLTGLVVAFLSRAMSERQVSSSSANQTRADLLAQGAVAMIVGDLRQEIAAGSTSSSPATGVTIYNPKNPAAVVPALVGSTGTGGLENLVKRSAYNQPFYPSADYDANASNRAAGPSTQSSTLLPSQNGRSISPARWNKAALLAKKNPATEDLLPVGATAATGTAAATWANAPDWILVARNGANPTAWNANLKDSSDSPTSVVGRYAYMIYDEGGLLDANVAGYPLGDGDPPYSTDNSDAEAAAYKSALAFADLTQLPGISDMDPAKQKTLINGLVGWRNYASAEPSGSLSDGFDFTGAPLTKFTSVVRANSTGFLETANTSLFGGQSDRMFTSRQELMTLLLQGIAGDSTDRVNLQNALQYLTHFSRALNQPSYVPAVQTDPTAPVVLPANLGGNSAVGGDQFINPSFPNVRVETSFTRSDGSTANVGDPLVNKRFALQRLAWITYKGPSATRNQNDPDIQSLIDSGVPWSYLQRGTDGNIQNYFGLTWDAGNDRWKYNVHNGGGTGSGTIMLVGQSDSAASADPSKYVQDANREPDFFELLKAGISVGSLGKAAQTSDNSIPADKVPFGYSAAEVPANVGYNFDTSVDYHVIQIGANILTAVNPTSYPSRIAFDDGTARGIWEFQGVTDLPYLTYIFNGVLRTELSSPAANYGAHVDNNPFQFPQATGPADATVANAGKAYAIQVPGVWNPYDPNGTAGVLRPSRFRIVIDSNDPVNLASGSSNHRVWCAGLASPRTSGQAGANDGLGAPWIPGTISSLQATSNPTSPTGNPVSDSVTFEDNNGALYREPTLIFSTNVGGAARTAGNITSIDSNPLGNGDSGPFAPLVLGEFPLAFHYSERWPNGTNYDTRPNPILYSGMGAIGHGGPLSEVGDNRVYFTYRLQYEDPSGNWVTYDTKYGRTTYGQFSFQSRGNFSPCVIKGPDGFSPYSWAAAIDPRTSRFGLMMDVMNHRRSTVGSNIAPPIDGNDGGTYRVGGWIYDSSGSPSPARQITYPIRPDHLSGYYFANIDSSDVVNVQPLGGQDNNRSLQLGGSLIDVPFPSFAAGWTRPICDLGGNKPIFVPGMYAQNNPGAPWYIGRHVGYDSPQTSARQPSYYADADGVVRRASGAYVKANTASGASATEPVGLSPASIQGFPDEPATLKTPSSATPFTQSQSRPLLLHRPFRTVAELGYVFRDVPWKNLDFFTPESGDAALLDLFCIGETNDSDGMEAGRTNLNTRQAPVLKAIASGACVDDPKISNAIVGSISDILSDSIASAMTARTTDTASFGPLWNLSELVGKWNAKVSITPGFNYDRSVPGENSGIDLPASDYKDGRLSYVGFSGAASTSSEPAVNLTDAYATVSNSSLLTGLNQIQRFHEAPIRALASVGQTRVWNLMIDLVAQTGRYPQSAAALDGFVVEGEQRYWVHIAIDRLTGQVIDKQVEVVKE